MHGSTRASSAIGRESLRRAVSAPPNRQLKERVLTLRPRSPLRSDEKILFDDSQPMETVNRQLIRAKLNYAEVNG